MGGFSFGGVNAFGGQPVSGFGFRVAIGAGAFHHKHREPEYILLNEGQCPPQMAEVVRQEVLVVKPRHDRVIVVDEQPRPAVIYEHPAQGPLVEDRYQKAKPEGPGVDPETAKKIYADAAMLDAFRGETHLNFKTDTDGYARAGTQGLESLIHKSDLEKTDREAHYRNDPDFVQNLLGGPNSGLQFRDKHVVITKPLTDEEKAIFNQNKDAIGEAVRGHYENAKNMYNSILQNGGIPSSGRADEGPDPAAQNMAPVDSNAKQNTGNPPPPVAEKPAPAAAVPPAVDPHLDDRLNQKDKVGEAQEILQKYFSQPVKLDGIDTRKDGGQGETDRALSKILGHSVSGGMTQRDLNELEIKAHLSNEDKTKILNDVSQKLHLSGVEISDSAYVNGKSSTTSKSLNEALQQAQDFAKHPVDSTKSAFEKWNYTAHKAYDDAHKKAGKPTASRTADTGTTPDVNDLVYRSGDGKMPTSQNLNFTPDDAKAVKLATADVTHVDSGTNVAPKAVKPAPQQNSNLVQI